MTYFNDYVFNKLDVYFHRNDSYKDTNGDGLLKRFLRSLELEWNTNVLPKVDNFTDILYPLGTTEPLLTHIAYSIGSPLNLLGESSGFEFFYRNYLNYHISINRYKGTALSYELMFGILGYKITLIILEEPSYNYDPDDVNITYDSGAQYDTDGCSECGRYSIVLTAINTPPPLIINEDTIPLINSIINYLQPADMKLTGGLLAIFIDDVGDLITYTTSNDVVFELLPNGDLQVTAFNSTQYSINAQGDLILTT